MDIGSWRKKKIDIIEYGERERTLVCLILFGFYDFFFLNLYFPLIFKNR